MQDKYDPSRAFEPELWSRLASGEAYKLKPKCILDRSCYCEVRQTALHSTLLALVVCGWRRGRPTSRSPSASGQELLLRGEALHSEASTAALYRVNSDSQCLQCEL
jgi:hypothetical protein